MTRHCAISVDVTGVEPALGPLNGHILVGGRTPFAERVVRRVPGSHKPRPSQNHQKRSALAEALLVLSDRLFGGSPPKASLTTSLLELSALKVRKPLTGGRLVQGSLPVGRIPGCHEGFHPLPAAIAAIEKELTSLFSPCFCAKHGQDLTSFATSCRRVAPLDKSKYIYINNSKLCQ